MLTFSSSQHRSVSQLFGSFVGIRTVGTKRGFGCAFVCINGFPEVFLKPWIVGGFLFLTSYHCVFKWFHLKKACTQIMSWWMLLLYCVENALRDEKYVNRGLAETWTCLFLVRWGYIFPLPLINPHSFEELDQQFRMCLLACSGPVCLVCLAFCDGVGDLS